MDAKRGNRSFYIKHKDQTGFDPVKFTPQIIANKKQLDEQELINYFLDSHTLGDCAKKFDCSEITIRRRLRKNGIDTSIYNHTSVATAKFKRKYKLPDDELRRLYIDDNLDSKTIAESQNPPVCYNIVRKHIRKLKLTKTRQQIAKSMSARHFLKHGVRHPAQRPDTLTKTRRSMARVRYRSLSGAIYDFRSLTECAYALSLDSRGLEWYYEEASVQYVDMISGKSRLYSIDFTVLNQEMVEWIEVKPSNLMIPDDKRIYATRRAEEAGIIYRGLTDSERQDMWRLIDSDYRLHEIELLYNTPAKNAKQISYLFKSTDSAQTFSIPGWHRHSLKKYKGSLCVLVLRRSNEISTSTV